MTYLLFCPFAEALHATLCFMLLLFSSPVLSLGCSFVPFLHCVGPARLFVCFCWLLLEWLFLQLVLWLSFFNLSISSALILLFIDIHFSDVFHNLCIHSSGSFCLGLCLVLSLFLFSLSLWVRTEEGYRKTSKTCETVRSTRPPLNRKARCLKKLFSLSSDPTTM